MVIFLPSKLLEPKHPPDQSRLWFSLLQFRQVLCYRRKRDLIRHEDSFTNLDHKRIKGQHYKVCKIKYVNWYYILKKSRINKYIPPTDLNFSNILTIKSQYTRSITSRCIVILSHANRESRTWQSTLPYTQNYRKKNCSK